MALERYRLDFGLPGFDVCRAYMPAIEIERLGTGSHAVVATIQGECDTFHKKGRREDRYGRCAGDLHFTAARPGERWISASSHETMGVQIIIPDALLRQAWVDADDEAPERLQMLDRPRFRDDRTAWIVRSIHAAISHDGHRERAYEQSLALMMTRHLVATRSNRALRPRRETLTPMRLRRVMDYVESNLDQPLGIDDLAAQAGISAFHFARAFKAATGLPPHQHILRRRAERAHDLLRERRDRSLADVAASVGFFDQSHLGQVLRRLFGLTPRSLRALDDGRPPPSEIIARIS